MKLAAKGTVFSVADAATGLVFTPVAQVASISGPQMSRDALDVSCHESPGSARQFVAGFRDAGEVTLGLRFDPSDATQNETIDGLLLLWENGEITPMQIVWPNAAASEWDFSGIVTGYSPDAPFDDVLGAEVTIKLTGAPVFTSAPV